MSRAWKRYTTVVAAVTLILCYFLLTRIDTDPTASLPAFEGPAGEIGKDASHHPIDTLIQEAQISFHRILEKRSTTLEEAASRYRQRRSRHPPPGFDAWFAAAKSRKAIVVEEFFDRIHHDLNPFWALDPRQVRRQARDQIEVIRVRNGKVSFTTENPAKLSQWQLFLDWLFPQYRRPTWIELWSELVEEMMPHLPDLDMPVNVMDETRLLVPWETIDRYVAVEQETRKVVDPKEVITEFSSLAEEESDDKTTGSKFNPNWITTEEHQYWDHLRAACSPSSPSRNLSSLASLSGPVDYPATPVNEYTYQGFVRNFTASQNPCLQPYLRGMHGTFIESVSMSTTHELIPMFAGSKIRQNNEILIPAAAYLTRHAFYSGGSGHGGPWTSKRNGLVWRGVASGGRNKVDTWWHYHRHRFIQMLNGTAVSALEDGEGDKAAPTFKLPSEHMYPDLKKRLGGKIGQWLSRVSDVGFVDLNCWPEVELKNTKETGRELQKTCEYTSPYYDIVNRMPMSQQYNYKLIPDVDGNSFSGRWRGFLLSTSLPLKATIYTEWHDDRMIPWVHFVPFDSTYMDIHGIMNYFMHGHDTEAQRIAEEGKMWAEKVYRREDMVLYVWRLLLEYARVVDQKRDNLAFVEDLRQT